MYKNKAQFQTGFSPAEFMLIGNLKRSINVTYHAIQTKYLPRYLAEFCYRFNRRFDLQTLMTRKIWASR